MTLADRDFSLIQDFIVGRLSDDECRDFEERLVRDPTLVRNLEQSLRMSEGLHRLRTRGYIRQAASIRRGLRSWTPAALAAAAIIGLALFLWLPPLAGPPSLLMVASATHSRGGAAVPVAAHFTFVSMRGASTPDIELPSAGLIEIRAAPASRRADEHYRVWLLNRGDERRSETIASLAGLALGDDGYVHCYVDAARLTSGSYVLRIQPEDENPGSAEVFPFNLTGGRSASSH